MMVDAGRIPEFQARGVRQGRNFEALCRDLLYDYGFKCFPKRKIAAIGVEIDIPTVSPGGREIWFNCKGSWFGSRPGLRRTDTLKKAMLEGLLCKLGANEMDSFPPTVLLTSHLPKPGSVGHLWIERLKGEIFEDIICVTDPADIARLEKIARVRGATRTDQLGLG